MSAMASHITDVPIVCSTVCSGAAQRKHQSSASLAIVREIHRWPVDSPHKWSVTRKMFPFDDVIMHDILCVTTHLLSVERADWPKLHDMFKARDAKTWQRKFPPGFPVKFVPWICYSSTLFTMLLFVWKANAWLKLKRSCNFPSQINRPTRPVLLHSTV